MTITITTIILLLATETVVVTLVHGRQNDRFIKNCCQLGYGHFTFSRKTKGPSGLYILPNYCKDDHLVEAEAYCDTSNGGGGWLVVQRRQDGSVNFNRTWLEYEDGFGNLTGEFWYGLRALHCLTGQGGWEMRMDIKLANGKKIFLQYEQFKVASAKDKYKLTVEGFLGTTTDPMAYHNGMFFTTNDSDNDKRDRGNCALTYGLAKPAGGWWYKYCWSINPNNFYNYYEGVQVNNKWYGIPFMEMKIRKHNCMI